MAEEGRIPEKGGMTEGKNRSGEEGQNVEDTP